MSDEFSAYKSDPSADTLIRLLRASQDRIYRLCFQVLRRPPDAEDAAQEVLIRIIDGARKLPDPDAFRRWVYRVSLNAALESARKSARRRAHESRAAMTAPPEALDEESRRQLFEGLAALDDPARALLLNHYFEGETLETIAAREGVTGQAVSKRLEKARGELRAVLPASVAVVVLADLGRLFLDRPAAPDLVSGTVLAKAHSFAASAAAGGFVMATKGTTVTAVVITAVLCLGVGTGVGLAIKRRTEHAVHVPAEGKSHQSASKQPQTEIDTSETAVATVPQPRDSGPMKESPLATRLSRYKAFKDAWKREREAMAAKGPGEYEARSSYSMRKSREQTEELEGMWKLAFAAPEEFMAFVREPGNEPYLDGFVINALGFATVQPEGFTMVRPKAFGTFPAEITAGMMDLAKSGTPVQRSMAMDFFARVTGTPPEMYETFRTMLLDADPSVQVAAINVLSGSGGTSPEDLKAILATGASSPHSTVRNRIINTLRYSDSPEATAYLVDKIESPRDDAEFVSAAVAIGGKLMMATKTTFSSVPSEESYLAAIEAGWGRVKDEGSFRAIVSTLLGVPGDKMKPVLEKGLAFAPSPKSKELLASILKRMNDGETNRQALMSAVIGK